AGAPAARAGTARAARARAAAATASAARSAAPSTGLTMGSRRAFGVPAASTFRREIADELAGFAPRGLQGGRSGRGAHHHPGDPRLRLALGRGQRRGSPAPPGNAYDARQGLAEPRRHGARPVPESGDGLGAAGAHGAFPGGL